VRLAGLNAAERGTPEGDAATEFVKSVVQPGDLIKVTFSKAGGSQEKYGRWIGQIILSDGTNLNEELIKTNHALPWDGTGKRPV
jgi:endonuclease YncB( thermonuclease family)